ncbi:LacI family DNA-binding transcriptional regulator [Tranquillimonas alkanivorans]|uniref:Transcriptional regulator, LacI family n=1 Tax=Tranquillimonas alkanivorans TaxID=441119 RepID=A0A1I5RGB9_9RHOB|nr:substrate-binding domain-containing protein [Tranquillimonas alkanivorans]SFP57410.1 transcriptional regulator, LacI family [Tranquillimonas alkanivorans]
MNLRELSKTLGLSQTTVSRALNGYPEVSEATRKRVEAAALRHDYRPNTRAKSLATGRTMTIAHVIPMSTKHEMVNPVFADFIAGAGETYQKAGYDMLLSVVSDPEEANAYRGLAARNTVDGMIVHAPRAEDPRLALLRKLDVPFVVHGRFPGVDEGDGYSWLDTNNRRGFERATSFLIDLGHRRIALINGLPELDFAIRREDGYRRALDAAGLPFDPALVRGDEMTEFYGHDAAAEMLDAPDPPTAFLTSSMIVAMGVRRAIQDRGLALGRDVSVITHDDDLSYFRTSTPEPTFTALHSSVRDHGRKCAQMLIDLIADRTRAPMRELLEADFLVGRSTGPAPAADWRITATQRD